ncbi:hypothetical protein [Salinilacihabitans rarus]|uniref:hypothetical protein n=1 Tax=Salinilacihabitans rarus TaxID=2961596 RepID=UPI0020C89DE5|nr:hypothetical protein [Salinilacihabitans rarus]
MSDGNAYYAFANGVQTETVCYTNIRNTRACVVVPEDIPVDHLHEVMHLSRCNGFVCTHVNPLDGEAFDFELEFTPIDAVDINRGDGSDE